MSMSSRRERCRSWTLYAITCPTAAGQNPLKAVEDALKGGASVVQLRDKNASDAELLSQAKNLLALTRRYGVPLIVNDRAHVAKEAGADGLHLGQDDGSLAEARILLGELALIGRSTHSPEQALAAEKEGFDYIGVGPVYETPTKPGRPAVGLEFVRFAANNLKVPFTAIGGIDEKNVGSVLDAGARTVAFVRAVMAQAHPAEAAKKLNTLILERKTSR